MRGFDFITVRIVDESPTCRLCGDRKIEWSYQGLEYAWLCFNCDIDEDHDEAE